MTRLFCLALVLFGLGGCSSATTDAAPTVVPGTSPTVSAETTRIPSVSTPVAVEVTCGAITVSGNPSRAADADAARQAAACFVQAFQSCTTSTLVIQDATNNLVRQFTIAPASGSCTLRQALQTDPTAPPAVADCKDARLEKNALMIKSCSHLGDFTLTP